MNILTIPVGICPVNYNLVHDYGQMSLQDTQAEVQTYMGQQVRSVQDSYMLYRFIMESLTDTFKAQVLHYEADYTITPVIGLLPMKGGPTLLKQVIMLAYINNHVTTAHFCETLIDWGTNSPPSMMIPLHLMTGSMNKSGS